MVREKLTDLVERDYKRLFQPCIDGNEIMEMFHLKPSREVGLLKSALKEAILEETIPNEREAAIEFLQAEAKKLRIKIH